MKRLYLDISTQILSKTLNTMFKPVLAKQASDSIAEVKIYDRFHHIKYKISTNVSGNRLFLYLEMLILLHNSVNKSHNRAGTSLWKDQFRNLKPRVVAGSGARWSCLTRTHCQH